MRKIFGLSLMVLLLAVTAVGFAQDEEISFEFWHIQSAGAVPDLLQAQVDRYMADNPNVTVEVLPMQNDPYKTRIRTAIGAGNEPCVFMSWGGGPMLEYVEAGTIIPLTDYFEEGDYGERFIPASFANVTGPEGEIYGVPVENVVVAGFFYNEQMFEDLGLEVPQTLEELESVADTLVENGITPFSLAGASKWTSSMYYMYLADRLGSPEFFRAAADPDVEGTFAAEPFVEAGEVIQEWVDAGYFVEGFNALDYDTGQSRIPLYANQAAMQLIGSWEIFTIKDENPDFFENLGFFPFPVADESQIGSGNVVGTVGDNYYHISSSCEYPDEAFEMLTYQVDDQAIEERVEFGKIPPVAGISEQIEEPLLAQVVQNVESAASVQLWYDQYLPVELGEFHKDTMQALFGGQITPEEAAQRQADAVAEYYTD